MLQAAAAVEILQRRLSLTIWSLTHDFVNGRKFEYNVRRVEKAKLEEMLNRQCS